ncbi:MAG: glycosyl transferase family 1 [Pseudothermotoga sp.]|nr:glycosyl transferase family 1 [Pseudothermotoga sp.]
MRGIYFSYIDIDHQASLGIHKKIEGQIRAFKTLGVDISHVYFRSRELFFEGKRVAVYRNKIHKKLHYWRASIQIAREFKTDFVLIRYVFPSHIGTLLFLKQLTKQGVIVVLEVPTYPYDKEVKGNWAKLIGLFIDKSFRNFLKYHVQLVVTPAKGVESIFGVKAVNIPNGVDLSFMPKKSTSALSTEVFNMIAVANVNFWHGYDRVVRGLANYYKSTYSRKVYFHVVGSGEGLEDLKKMSVKLGVSEYVVFHGPKTGTELDTLFDQAHVAIGCLGIHRIKIAVSSALKVREYCARGVPFVLAGSDPDFPNDFPYMLRVPENDTPIDIGQVLDFYERVCKTNYVDEMRKFAEQNLSWESKLRPLVEEIKHLTSEM